nr:hypothetical protein [Acidianus ambivalens]
MIPQKYREYAKAYYSVKDNERAKKALEIKDYPECFFHAQQ